MMFVDRAVVVFSSVSRGLYCLVVVMKRGFSAEKLSVLMPLNQVRRE